MVLPQVFTVLLICFCFNVQSASILALFSTLSFSDHLVFRNYISLLTQRGHSIVMMTAYPGQFAYPDAERIVELNVGQESSAYWEEYRALLTNTDDYYPRMRAINDFSLKLAVVQLNSKPMKALLANPNVKFDLVITEADVPLLYAAADKYEAPHIAITASSGRIHQYESKGSSVHPTLYPDVNSLNYRNLSGWQKIVEINRYIQTKNEYYNTYLPRCDVAANKIFGLKRPLQEVEQDIDLLFVASNPVFIGNRPSTPGVIYVDRMHIKPGFALPEELKVALDSATRGAVYFSLGAFQEAEQLSPQLLQTLADAFRELPFLVLWKIGNTTMINDLPKNIISSEWLPQQEILAHPNLKAFITNGGGRSLEEAVFYGVPIIGLPIVRSRKVFIQEITRYDAGEILDLYHLEKEGLIDVISEVLSNDKYKNAMSKLKRTVQDNLLSGPDMAVWWTEYVLQNGGAKHLRSSAAGLSYFKYALLDIIGVLSTIFIILLSLLYFVLRFVLRRLRARIWPKYDESGKYKAL
ncbi:UDP-glycosyltransferase UGT5-like [Pararge aegeria]|uniref:UDP-glycosyltransferase UGT5-like n=1 Tax=Pararge aegeria TaxID=116150 RepID=UPI0019CFDCBE|nr:UDP-glycosyltransferase UGT5-like [Pararge aegeria]